MQVVGYSSGLGDLSYDPVAGINGDPGVPSLLLSDNGNVGNVPLEPGDELAFTLGDRHCAGDVVGDAHTPCDDPTVPHCPVHSDDWPCARCTGRCDKPLPACDEEHAVYLAVFAPHVCKVGVTRLSRLPVRLREQGADRAAHLHTVSDGRIARRVERELATTLPDRATMETKLAGIATAVDEASWAAIVDQYEVLETFQFDYGFKLSQRPVPEILASGTIIGTKGRLLVLQHAASTYGVDLRDLVGYDISPGRSDRRLQSSLGAFQSS